MEELPRSRKRAEAEGCAALLPWLAARGYHFDIRATQRNSAQACLCELGRLSATRLGRDLSDNGETNRSNQQWTRLLMRGMAMVEGRLVALTIIGVGLFQQLCQQLACAAASTGRCSQFAAILLKSRRLAADSLSNRSSICRVPCRHDGLRLWCHEVRIGTGANPYTQTIQWRTICRREPLISQSAMPFR